MEVFEREKLWASTGLFGDWRGGRNQEEILKRSCGWRGYGRGRCGWRCYGRGNDDPTQRLLGKKLIDKKKFPPPHAPAQLAKIKMKSPPHPAPHTSLKKQK